MSTKNLARTAIEGGRRGHNKFERRNSRAVERASARQTVSRQRRLVNPDDDVRPIKTTKVRPEFADKLSSLTRYLDANLSRPWRLVYSELRKKYDARTTAGRHILFDHLLGSVYGSGQPQPSDATYRRYYTYYVSDAGLLMKNKPRPRFRRPRSTGLSLTKTARWLGGYGVIQQGSVLYWAVPTNNHRYTVEVVKARYHPYLVYRRLDRDGKPAFLKRWSPYYGAAGAELITLPDYEQPRFRQDKRMAEADVKVFASLSDDIKDWLLRQR